jgi:DNA-binding GntR family transcriptional regulator
MGDNFLIDIRFYLFCDGYIINHIHNMSSKKYNQGMSALQTKKDKVYQQIRKAILSGELKAGEILKEGELAQRYEAGKTPTREALIVLSYEKFLEPMPRVGYIVVKPSIQDVLETFHLRMLLEVEAIGLAAERMSEEIIRELEQNNQAENELGSHYSGQELKERATELNRDFHLIIAQASGNARLAQIVRQLLDDMERMLSEDPYLADPTQHLQMLESLKERDKEGAQEAMRQHLEETKSRIVNRFG